MKQGGSIRFCLQASFHVVSFSLSCITVNRPSQSEPDSCCLQPRFPTVKAPEECGNLYEESFELAGEELREMESIAVLSDQLPSPSDQVSREAILKYSAIDGREWFFEVRSFLKFRMRCVT